MQHQKNVLRQALQSSSGYPFTPDLWRLEKKLRHLIFVTDEWMSDRHQSLVLKDEDTKRHGWGYTNDKFNFLTKSTTPGNTPVILQDRKGLRIMGEVWEIPTNLFIKLDKLKQHGLQSLRYRSLILFPWHESGTVINGDGYYTDDGYELPEALQGRKHWIGPERIYVLECWMYIGHPTYWLDMVHTNPAFFNRVQSFTPKKKRQWLSEYYRYQNPTSVG